jgi:hypothetical protein
VSQQTAPSSSPSSIPNDDDEEEEEEDDTEGNNVPRLVIDIPIVLEVTDISKKLYKKSGEIYFVTTFSSKDKKMTIKKELEYKMKIEDKIVIAVKEIKSNVLP